MPGPLASPHWLLLMGLTGGGQSTPGSSFNHSVNKYLLSTHFCQAQCWGYSNEQHHCGPCLVKMPNSLSVCHRGKDRNEYLLSAYCMPDSLLGLFLKFPDCGRPKRLY